VLRGHGERFDFVAVIPNSRRGKAGTPPAWLPAFPAQELASRGCVIHVPREPKGACYAHWEGPVGRVPRSGCAELGEARARPATSRALAGVRGVSRNGLGNAVVRRPWQVEYARSLRLHIVPAKLNMPTAACYCPGGDRRGQFCYHPRGAMGKGRTADHPQKAGYPPHVNSSRSLRPFRLF